jgi:plastocyanin
MKDFINRRGIATLAIGAALLAAACSNDAKGTAGAAPEASASKTGESAERGGHGEKGKVIVVQLTSDAKGNYFTPTDVEAERGDTVRFTLGVGVHNVNFLPDSNAGKSGLPKASDMLQLPGQAYDVPVTFANGRYYFQCDPHALLGMKGHLTVKD